MTRLNEVDADARIKAEEIVGSSRRCDEERWVSLKWVCSRAMDVTTQNHLTWFAKDWATLETIYRARVLKDEMEATDLDEDAL